MIEITKNYKITITEDQTRQLYRLLQLASSGQGFTYGEQYDELGTLHDELKELFETGIR